LKVTKGAAYVRAIWSILGVYGVSIAYTFAGWAMSAPATRGPLPTVQFVGEVLAAIVAATVAYIGGNVAGNGVKGKYYESGLASQGGK
jgi:hypothetical protein